jgi:hypothetical protein
MEKFIYEARPFFFLISGIVAIVIQTGPLMLVSGGILVGASVVVLYSRYKHRT